jgi:myo-inositol-1(or 4)-monophosphatase
MLDLQLALQTAHAAADAARDVLVPAWERHRDSRTSDAINIRTKSSERDFVTALDGEAQAAIIRVISAQFPTHRFIAEEEGADAIGDPKSPAAWIIDPLDGTSNFIHRKPNFGTLIALEWEGEIVLGLIVRHIANKRYDGIRDGTACCNGTPIRLRETKNMVDAIVCSNIMGQCKRDGDVCSVRFPYCGSVENYGNATQEASEVLDGTNDAVVFHGVGYWDAAPGAFLIQLAGGRSRLEPMDKHNIRKGVRCVMSTKPIFPMLEKFLFEEESTRGS